VVVAAISGLVIVRPWYVDYLARARLSEVFFLLSYCEPYMAEQIYAHKKFFPLDAKPSDCGLSDSSRYVSAFHVSGSRVDARLRDVHPDIDGHMVFIEAVAEKAGNAIQLWRCGTNAPEKALRLIPRGCSELG
jgi:hypothetical protein